jgi:hypothetical protein
VAAILYNSSEASVKVGNKGNTVVLKQSTNYPFDENIKIEITTASSQTFPLYLRIPNWCGEAKIKINGTIQSQTFEPSSYARIERKWSQGDIVELILPLTFSLKIEEYYKEMDGRKSAEEDSKWQANADHSKWKSYEIYPVTSWNYGLMLNNQSLESQFEIIKKPWSNNDFPFTQESVPIYLKAKGKIIPEWILDKNGLCDILPQSPVEASTKIQDIELIPMGAARLRISSFPVIK